MPVFIRGNTAVLFVHVPKAGGTSVEKLFGDSGYSVHSLDRDTTPGSPNWLRWCSPQHMDAEKLAASYRLERFDVVFMIVREPVARFKSEYAMRNQQRLWAERADVEQWGNRALRAYRRDPHVYDNHIRPQADFHVPGSHVYRLEDGLDTAINDLDGQFGLGLATHVPHELERKALAGHASDEVRLSPTLEARLRDFYSRDYSLFGYR